MVYFNSARDDIDVVTVTSIDLLANLFSLFGDDGGDITPGDTRSGGK